jgi:peptidoglycan/LPS O-acetylase OafA/YrhL
MIGTGVFRYALALAVLFLHADFVTFEVAQIAVLTFFYISGFLMERSYSRYSSARRFLLNRSLRLLPIFLIVATATWTIITLATEEFRRAFGFIYLREATNYPQSSPPIQSIAGIEWDGSIPYLGFESELIPQAWSIGNEMVYYLTVPLLALSKRRGLIALSLIGAAFLAIQLSLRIEEFDFFLYTNLLVTYAFFVVGFLTSRILKNQASVSEKLSLWSGRLGLVLVLLSYLFDFPDDASPLLVIFYSLVLIVTITLGPLSAAQGRERALSRFLGKLSYPLYISHMITIGILNYYSTLNLPWLIFTSLLLALILHLTIDQPIEELRSAIKRSRN